MNKKAKLDTVPIPRFRELMDNTETKREEIATALGVSTVAIGQYYNGEALPSIEKLIKIADFFNVSTDYLLGRTDVSTIDAEIKAICKYTGLSETSVNNLHTAHKLKKDVKASFYNGLNLFIECDETKDFFLLLDDYEKECEINMCVVNELIANATKIEEIKENKYYKDSNDKSDLILFKLQKTLNFITRFIEDYGTLHEKDAKVAWEMRKNG